MNFSVTAPGRAIYEQPASIKSKEVQKSFFDFNDEPAPVGAPWKADFLAIEQYFRGRLRSIFAKVADNSVGLMNSKGIPLYSLFFMAANEKGARIAVKIAESIMSRPWFPGQT